MKPPHPKRRRSPRGLLSLLTLPLAAVITLAGCSSSGSDDGSGSSSATDSAASDSGTFPATVATQFGDVTVDAKPEKVVALGWADAEMLYALGVQPIAMSDWLAYGGDGVGPWATSLVTEPAEQLGTTELDFEAINDLAPDLILNTRSDNSEDTYDTLSAIAPTVYGPEGVTSYGTSWEQQMTSVSEAVGLPEKGQQIIADTKAKVADVASENPELDGRSFAVGALFGTDQWGAYVSGDIRVDFLTGLGMTNKTEIESQKKDSFFISVSAENLELFDADLTLLFAIGDNNAALEGNTVIQSLPSTKAGHLLILSNDEAQAYSTGSTLALDYALENVAPKIATAVAGS